MRSIREIAHIEARYWSGSSSAYGTGDQLLGMVWAGWRIATIGRITRCIRGRFFTVYLFELRYQNQMTVMHIVENPVIQQLVKKEVSQEFWEQTVADYEEDDKSVEITVFSPVKMRAFS